MKTIAVPFDFSSYSLAALKTAQKISAKTNANILVITVIPSEVDFEKLSEEAKKKYSELTEQKQEAELVLPEYVREIAPAKSQIDYQVKVGVPWEMILRSIKEENVELLVMGAYGKGYSEGKFIGSTLQKVLRNSPCPVLAVKEALDGNDLRKIAFCSNFHLKSRESFSIIKSLLKAFKCSVNLLYVNTPDHFTSSEEVKKGMDMFQKGNEEIVFHQHIHNAKEVENGIINFTSENGIKWIAIETGHHEKSLSYQVGTTETVLFKGNLGVLSIKQ